MVALYTVLQFFHPVFPFFTAVLAVRNGNLSPKLVLMYFQRLFCLPSLMQEPSIVKYDYKYDPSYPFLEVAHCMR